MSHSFVNFVTFLLSTKRKCPTCDIIVLNKTTLINAVKMQLTRSSVREFVRELVFCVVGDEMVPPPWHCLVQV